MRRTIQSALLWLALGATASASSPEAPALGCPATNGKKPNFVLIMTDDQDKLLKSVDYQPAVQKHFVEQGLTFEKHFCTQAQCCPSRVSFLTGMHGHNTNVTDVVAPWGGYTKFVQQGFHDNYLPVWLQEAGYNTYYAGKFMNGHSEATWNDPLPKGFNQTNFLIEPGVYVYYNGTYQKNDEPPVYMPGKYSTDVMAETAVEFIEDAASHKDRPFFINVMPVGPHFEPDGPLGDTAGGMLPPVPAERHADLFPGVTVPRTENFNPLTPGAASYFKTLDRHNDTVVEYLDLFYRKRLQTLQSVDDLVNDVLDKLEELDLLDNTYVMYTSDNGFHIGNHRLMAGKTTCYEEDVNIPFYIRGPGVPKNKRVHYPTTHIDLAPTIYQLAGIPLRPEFDGTPMPVTEKIPATKPEHVNIEFWGFNYEEGKYASLGFSNDTYKALRIMGAGYDLSYVTWCTNEHELYDMMTDTAQMHNLYHDDSKYLFGYPISKVISRLNGLMMVTKTCKGKDCIRPWNVIHPDGDVETIRDAMDPKFDDFYEKEMPQVSYDYCTRGYYAEIEGPQTPAIFGSV